MATPADRGWGNPGRKHGDPQATEYGRRHITTITTSDGSKFAVRKELEHVFLGFLNEIIARGYRIKGTVLDDWGWFVRLIADTDDLSNHSWGLAIDVNAMTNPQGRVLRTDMPAFVPEAAKRWGLRWGGNYTMRPDAMHFEWTGSRDDALRFVADLKSLHAAGVATPIPPPEHEEDDMPLGLSVEDDRRAQIREWFMTYLGRGFEPGRWPDGKPFTAQDEQNLHLFILLTRGADICLAGIMDSDEATKRRAAA